MHNGERGSLHALGLRLGPGPRARSRGLNSSLYLGEEGGGGGGKFE